MLFRHSGRNTHDLLGGGVLVVENNAPGQAFVDLSAVEVAFSNLFQQVQSIAAEVEKPKTGGASSWQIPSTASSKECKTR